MNAPIVHVYIEQKYSDVFKKQFNNFIFLPPLRPFELLNSNPDVVAIVDCDEKMDIKVSTGEILDLLRKGILLYGAGSFGAYSAAICQKFGMVGCGILFEQIQNNFEIEPNILKTTEVDVLILLNKIKFDLLKIENLNRLIWSNQSVQLENAKIEYIWKKYNEGQ